MHQRSSVRRVPASRPRRLYKLRTQQEQNELARLVFEEGYSRNKASLELGIPKSTGKNLIKIYQAINGNTYPPLHHQTQQNLLNSPQNAEEEDPNHDAHESTHHQTSSMSYIYFPISWDPSYIFYYNA